MASACALGEEERISWTRDSAFLPKIGPKDAEDQKLAPFLMFEYEPYHKVVKQVKKDDFANRQNFTTK